MTAGKTPRATAQPSSRWRKVKLDGGAKGQRVVRVLDTWVQAKDEDGGSGPRERLVVIRTIDRAPQVWYTLSNARDEVTVQQVVLAHARRHGVEEVLQAGKGEVGLGHYEVRSWVGWHHPMTLSRLALWFLILEKERLGEKIPALTVPQRRELLVRVLAAEQAVWRYGGGLGGAASWLRGVRDAAVDVARETMGSVPGFQPLFDETVRGSARSLRGRRVMWEGEVLGTPSGEPVRFHETLPHVGPSGEPD